MASVQPHGPDHGRIPPEQELALLLAGTATRRGSSAERMHALASTVDERELLAFLRYQRVDAVLGRRLRDLAPGCLSDGAWGVLAGWRRNAERLGDHRSLLVEALRRHLRRLGIRNVPLKGTALAERLYGHPGLRSSTDIDVLVDVDRLWDAVEAVAHLGWTRPTWTPTRPGELPRLHVQVAHSAGLPPVEIHWRTDWRDEGALARDMLARATDGGLSERDEVTALLLFYARDGFAGLRLALDLASWWDRFGSGLPPDGLTSVATAHHRLGPALRAAAATAESLVGVPAGALLPGQRLHRRERLAGDLANWRLRGDPDRIHSDISMVDAVLTPRGDTGSYIRRHVLPAPSVIAQYYGVPERARLRLAFWRVIHPIKVFSRYAWTFWQTRLAGGDRT